MKSINWSGVGAWMAIIGAAWAAILHFSDPGIQVRGAMIMASIGLLVLTLFQDQDDGDDGPPTAEDLADDDG